MHRALSPHSQRQSQPRRAFTLTELLVVITIIAMLAALVTAGVFRALDSAKQTRIKLEVDGLDAAMKAYKEKYGSYPPCDLRIDPAATSVQPFFNAPLRQHIARAFPRYNLTNINRFVAELQLAGVETSTTGAFRPDQALVFWLKGFSPDVSNPFLTPDGRQIANGIIAVPAVKPAVTPFYDFDKSRLWQTPTLGGLASALISPTLTTAPIPVASYFPQGSTPPSSNAAPYLYWEGQSVTTTPPATNPRIVSSNYGTISLTPVAAPTSATPTPFQFNSASFQIFPNAGVAEPYWFDSVTTTPNVTDPTENWVNVDSFQIISAGMDGKYGSASPGTTARLYPGGFNYDSSTDHADDDNVTNFNAKARLSDAKP